jgi:hypothetical protein
VVPRVLLGVVVLVVLMTPAFSRAEVVSEAQRGSNEHFRLGSAHYAAGRYREAIAEFELARQLVPHRATLFNLARCHENLGDGRAALELYRGALALTTAESERADIERRIAGIMERPVRVFVTSEPPGATVLVDAREQPEPSPTPATLELAPGAHHLLLRREGFQPTSHRLVVEVGDEQPVTVALDPLPTVETPTCSAAAACPPPTPCPDCRLAIREGLRVEISLAVPVSFLAMGQFEDVGSLGGLGFRTHISYNRLMIGGLINFSGAERTPAVEDSGPDERTSGFVQLVAEIGYLFLIRSVAVVRVTGGVGGLLELYNVSEEDGGTDYNGSVHGYVGGGIDVHALRWLSIGVDVHLGMGAPVDYKARNHRGGFDLIVMAGGYLNFILGNPR